MKKKIGLITSLFVLLLVLTSASSPVLAATTIEELGHKWENPYFAIVGDVNQPKDASIHLVEDLTPETAHEVTMPPDANTAFDNRFFFTYLNQNNIEVGYLALERLIKNTPIKYDRTAPFQALFTHFTNPAGADVFVVVNFDGLLAYSGGGKLDARLDQEDEIFLGLTFGGQGLADLLSFFYLQPNGLDPLPHFEVEPFFTQEDEKHYSFGMTYRNLLVTWLSLTSGKEENYEQLGSQLSGPQLKAISLFDYVTYQYNVAFKTEGDLEIAQISTNYSIGSTDIIAIGYENTPEVTDPEEKAQEHLLNWLEDHPTFEGEAINIEDLTPNKPEEHSAVMIYTKDLAKLRIRGPRDDTPGFGLAVVNSANIITVGDVTIKKDGKMLNPAAAEEVGSVTMTVNEQKTFETDYKTKGTYDLLWANGSRWEELPVFNTIIPTGRRGFNTPYFILQRLILVPWLLVIANELSKQQPGEKQITAEHYFIATQFPAWSGGHIIHDPNFTAYSNPEAVPPETTSEAPKTTSETPQVGEFSLPFKFELLLSTIVGVPILLLGAKRRNKIQ